MNRCCIEYFVARGLVENFRIADEGEIEECPGCGGRYVKLDGKWRKWRDDDDAEEVAR